MRDIARTGKSGIKYIVWDRDYGGNWIVKPKIDGKYVYLGKFKNLEDAKVKLLEETGELVTSENGEKYSLDIDYFKNIDSPRKAFWLGFICADGSITIKSNNQYQFRLSQENDVLLKEFIKDIKYTGKIKTKENAKGRFSSKMFYELNISRNEFSKNILKCGKSLYKKDQHSIPNSVPKEFYLDFIRGYFEGDGSVYRGNYNSGYTYIYAKISGFYSLLEEFKNYIETSINGCFGKISADRSIHCVKTKAHNTDSFMSLLYDNSSEVVFSKKYKKYKGLM